MKSKEIIGQIGICNYIQNCRDRRPRRPDQLRIKKEKKQIFRFA